LSDALAKQSSLRAGVLKLAVAAFQEFLGFDPPIGEILNLAVEIGLEFRNSGLTLLERLLFFPKARLQCDTLGLRFPA
jgi:hypothetical protein